MDFKSLLIYLSVFLLSLVSMWLGQNQMNTANNSVIGIRQKKFWSIFFFTVSLLFPVLLAGCRDISVGTDIKGYIIPNFEFAKDESLNFVSFYNSMPVKTEILYAVVLYIFGKLDNLFLLFTVIEILAIFPIFIVLIKMRRQISMPLGMAMYYFFFYNFGLSATRQIISMSFLLLAYYYLDQREYKRGIIISIIAFLFHSSVIIIAFLYISINLILKSRYKQYIITVIGIFMLFFFINYEELAENIADFIRYINPRYSYYIRHYLLLYNGFIGDNIPIAYAICQIVLVMIVAVLLFITKKTRIEDRQLLFLVLLGEYFVIFNGKFYESQRIAYYLNMFIMLYIPNVYKCFKNNFMNKLIITIIMISIAAAYWVFDIMYIGSYSTNVYSLR